MSQVDPGKYDVQLHLFDSQEQELACGFIRLELGELLPEEWTEDASATTTTTTNDPHGEEKCSAENKDSDACLKSTTQRAKEAKDVLLLGS